MHGILNKVLAIILSLSQILAPLVSFANYYRLYGRVIPTVGLSLLSTKVLADAFTAAAADGSVVGTNQVFNPSYGQYNGQLGIANPNASFSFPSGKTASGVPITQVMSVNQMFSGIDANAVNDTAAAVGAAQGNNLMGNSSALISLTNSLTAPASGILPVGRLTSQQPGQGTAQGNAFQALHAATLSAWKTNLSNDPVLTAVPNAVYGNSANMQNMLGSCAQTTVTQTTTNSTHVPNYKYCNRTFSPTSCNVSRVITGIKTTFSCTLGTDLVNPLHSNTIGTLPGPVIQNGWHPGQYGVWNANVVCDQNAGAWQKVHIHGSNEIFVPNIESWLWVDTSTINESKPKLAGTFSSGQKKGLATGNYWDWFSGLDYDGQVFSVYHGCTGSICNLTLYIISANKPTSEIFDPQANGGLSPFNSFLSNPAFLLGAPPPQISWINSIPPAGCPVGSIPGSQVNLLTNIIVDPVTNLATNVYAHPPINSCWSTINNGNVPLASDVRTGAGPFYYAVDSGTSVTHYYYSNTSVSLLGITQDYGFNDLTVNTNPSAFTKIDVQFDNPRIMYQVTDAIQEVPANCTKDSFCTANPVTTWVSTGSVQDMASNNAYNCINATNSYLYQGTFLTPDNSLGWSPLYPGVPPIPPNPICMSATSRNYTCNFNVGPQICYIDISGIQRCNANTGGTINTCSTLANDPTCSFVSEKCVYSDPVTGNCHYYSSTYDCGWTVNTPGLTSTTNALTCGGNVRCIGTECVTPWTDKPNNDFGKSTALASASEFTQMDSKCDPTGNCEIFKGKAYTCQMAYGNIADCCSQPTTTNLRDYMLIAKGAWDGMKATGAVDYVIGIGTKVAGSLSNWAANNITGYTDVTSALNTAYESLVGQSAAKVTTTATGQVAATYTQTLCNAIGNYMDSVLPGSGSLIFGQTAAAGTSATAGTVGATTTVGGATTQQVVNSSGQTLNYTGLQSNISAAIDIIGTVYMYYEIAVAVINTMYACRSEDFELASKKQLRSCHYVGEFCSQQPLGRACVAWKQAWCCYSSPLGRILQEKGRPQLGIPDPAPIAFNVVGTGNVNNLCAGLMLADFNKLDFETPDMQAGFNEWALLLAGSGRIPSSSTQANADYQMKPLTSDRYPDPTPGAAPIRVDTATYNSTVAPSTSSAGETGRGIVRKSLGW